jgi:hypothetical protein
MPTMRRLLSALLSAMLLAGLLPLQVLAADAPVLTIPGIPSPVDELVPLTFTATATDPDGDALAFDLADGTAGSVPTGASIDPVTGAFTWTPTASQGPGVYTFDVTVSDGELLDSETVTIAVRDTNRAPAFDQDLGDRTDAEGDVISLDAGATDPDGDALTYAATGLPAGLSISSTSGLVSGTIAYDAAASSPYSVSVTVRDGPTVAATDAFTWTIDNTNRAPTATVQSVTIAEDTAKGITLAGSDVDGNPLTYIVANPAHGTLNGTGAAQTYAPAANYVGADSFTFKVNDGTTDSTAATVSITVTPVNDAPTAIAQSATVTEDVAKAITLTGSDIEDEALTYTVVARPAHGTLSGSAPNLTYAPAANYVGTDSFTFKVNDGTTDSTAATVSIAVTPANDGPVARTDGFTVNATSTSTLAVLANDYSAPVVSGADSEPTDPITIASVGTATRGRVSIAAGGQAVIYDPTGCGTGGDSFTYTIVDGGGLTATATAFVTIARPGTNGLSSNPITDTPATGLVTNSTIGSTVPLRVSWCGVTMAGASVRSYKVAQSTNGGSTYPTTLYGSTTGTGSTRKLTVNTPYSWRVRTVDRAGRTGAYRTSLPARVTRYQESSTAITYAGAWGTTRSTSLSGGAQRRTKTAGATATITLTNVRQFAIVGPRSSGRGSFEVYVDGVLVKTVSEKATTTVYRRVLYVRSLTAGVSVKHAIEVRAVGDGQIDLDAILALS